MSASGISSIGWIGLAVCSCGTYRNMSSQVRNSTRRALGLRMLHAAAQSKQNHITTKTHRRSSDPMSSQIKANQHPYQACIRRCTRLHRVILSHQVDRPAPKHLAAGHVRNMSDRAPCEQPPHRGVRKRNKSTSEPKLQCPGERNAGGRWDGGSVGGMVKSSGSGSGETVGWEGRREDPPVDGRPRGGGRQAGVAHFCQHSKNLADACSGLLTQSPFCLHLNMTELNL